jgi:hypothetical protein
MTPTFSEKSTALNDSLIIGPARARRRLGAAVLTGVLALALAIPAPRSSQLVPAGHPARGTATTGPTSGGTLAVPEPVLPPGETGCCA